MSSRPNALASLAVAAAAVALILHGRRFDFVCDDAFITFRYARNLVDLGVPVYNAGERVEGYTSFLWMVLIAACYRLGVAPPTAAQWLGAASAAAVVASTWLLHRRLATRPNGWSSAFVLCLLASSAPVAAWSMAGLETALFTALVTLALALAGDVVLSPAVPRVVAAGGVFALATLTRPEGALFFAVAWGVVAASTRGRQERRKPAAPFLLGYTAIVAPFVAWRCAYYGYPLPNTFYVRFSGAAAPLVERGAEYVRFAGGELGIPMVLAVMLSLLLPLQVRAGSPHPDERRAVAIAWMGRILIPASVLYVMRVGGDFLDLYRFFVPVLPLSFAMVARLLAELERGRAAGEESGRRPSLRILAGALGLALLALHVRAQVRLGERALLVSEPERAKRHLEPLGWTRLYALRWAAAGRWIAAHAARGDSMASGAAGAMPYYAGIANIDLFGLTDELVARRGAVIGTRPGHQRFAPDWYILERRPTFLVLRPEAATRESTMPPADPHWESHGYAWIEAEVDAATYGAPGTFFLPMLVRAERVPGLARDPFTRIRSDS